MRPVLVSWGGLAVPSYETALAVGACLLITLTVATASRRGLPRRATALALAAAYAAGLLGARGLYAVETWATGGPLWATLLHPASGGLSSLGGLILGALAAALVALRLRLAWPRLADAAAVGLCVAAAVGRLGCLLAGCCHGRPTGLPWGIVYPRESPASALWGPGVAVHPTPLYEAGALLVLAGLLARWAPRPGGRWLGFVVGYALVRLLTDVTRGDLGRYGGLSLAQWLVVTCLALVLAGAGLGRRERERRPGIEDIPGVYSG